MRCLMNFGLPAVAVVAGNLLLAAAASAENEIYLHQIPEVTGIAFDAADPAKLRIATPYGLFLVSSDGAAEHVADDVGVLMALVAHPGRPSTFYSSGFRSRTEKLGVLRSEDAGVTWESIAEGADGPAAFLSMAISSADPATLYGVDGAVQVSRDGGLTWAVSGPAPGEVFDIAASALDPSALFAATRDGLMVSADGGATWRPAHPSRLPATMVDVAADGRIHAFVYGLGLLRAEEPDLDWALVSSGFEDRAIMTLAVDPTDGRRMLAVTDTGAVMVSADGGESWLDFEGRLEATPERIAQGRALYEETCAACHGAAGVGERPDDMYAMDEDGLVVAPPLDDSAHGWHHPDEQLVQIILEGSPRNPRMAAWRELLSPDDARAVVAYIKSLWSFRSLACQGARHMTCMR